MRGRVLYSATIDLGRLFVYNGDMETKPKKRGRPTIPEESKRTEAILVRVTSSEKAEFREAAFKSRIGLSQWIRDSLRWEARRDEPSQAG